MTITKWLIACVVILLIAIIYGSSLVLKNTELKTSIKYLYKDALTPHSNRNLMLGSSSIEQFKPEQYMDCGAWLNRGIGSSTIATVKRYISLSTLSISPSNILLYVGENDIPKGLVTAEIIKQYKELLLYLIAKYPSSELHVIAIKPSPARQLHWDEYYLINEAIEEFLSNKPGAYFHTPKWDTPKLEQVAEFTTDGIHLTDHGYSIFSAGVNEQCSRS